MIELTVEAVLNESPPTITPETPVPEAARLLREADAGALPVVEDGAAVGVVTESDIVALVADETDCPAVRAILSGPVRTIAPTATLVEAAEAMRSAGVEHLPVVSDGRYRGLLSAAALAPYLSRRHLDVARRTESPRADAAGGAELAAE